MCVIIPSWCRKHRTSLGLVYMKTGPCHAICSYCCSYTGIRIQLNVSPSLFAYLDKSMCVIIPSWCRIHRISLGLVYITTRHSHIIRFYHCIYTGISIQFTVSPSLFHISRQLDVHYNPLLVPYTSHVTRLSLYKLQTLSYHMILPLFIYRYKNQTERISVAIYISRQFDVHYNPLLVPYTLHVTRISLYKLQILSYHMILPLFIYRYKNST
jgi:hypothetical protein